MKKIIPLLLAIALAFSAAPAALAAESIDAAWLDASAANKGTVGITLGSDTDKLTKAKVSKDGRSYTYTVSKADAEHPVWLPLQMGNGTYTVTLLENVKGNQYKVLRTQKVDVKLDNATVPFLNAVQNVNWKNAEDAVGKATKLVKGAKTNEQKAKAIHAFLIGAIKYDNELAKSVTSEYIPDIDGTLASGKAICYGYASLYAAMLRSQGIPAKLVMGTTSYVKGYHAWNEVYLNGKWVVVDATVDAGLKKAGKPFSFAKSAKEYAAEKVY
ncbi:transglutaminase-like domain-containing protein [Cohnella suwonensis]|uniref:Transglutaminase-like domain-containing protein n=1 Tax=Cohnella suwonensis TaxID=696072 RepID=A0ABW0LRF6_9BACL